MDGLAQPPQPPYDHAALLAAHNLNLRHRQDAMHQIPHHMGQQFGLQNQQGQPHIKEEAQFMLDSMDMYNGQLQPEYEFGDLDMATQHAKLALLSPLSSSPLDPEDLIARNQDGKLLDSSASFSTSMGASPYGTPGLQMPTNFYSMSVPLHASNGFIDHTKIMGSQPSSFGGYGQVPPDGLIEDMSSRPRLDVTNEKRRRRRESHNAVERRRRDNINDKIQELATLLPGFPSEVQNKPNKGAILRRSVDYIRLMQNFATRQVDRNVELTNAIKFLLAHSGVQESELELTIPLEQAVELPTVPPPSAAELHVEHHAEYGLE